MERDRDDMIHKHYDSPEWRRLTELGIEEQDHEHREILWMIMAMRNLVNSSVKDKSKHNALKLLVDDAVQFVQRHFAEEESLMSRSGYPGYLDHKKEHEAFLQRLLDLRAQVQRNRKPLTTETVTLMKDWLYRHVLESDRPLIPHLVRSSLHSRISGGCDDPPGQLK